MTERRLGLAMLVLAGAAVALGLATWWRTTGEAPQGQPVASVAGAVLERDPASPDLTAELQRSVRLVRVEGCGTDRQATATVIDRGDRTTALTNQHVVAGATDVRVDGLADAIDVTGTVDGRDAAELDGERMVADGSVPLEEGSRPAIGAQVVVAGYPGGKFEAMAGHVQGIEARQGYGGTADVLLLDVEAVPGISGGVVVDVTGRAVALVAARDPVTHEVVAYPLDVLDEATAGTTAPCAG